MFRRGKLAFLSTKDDRIKVINERINLTEKHLIEMCATFSGCTRKMAKFRDSYDELGKGLKNYADDEEINESLSEGLRNFTNAVTILGDYMDLSVHRMEAKIVNELALFENLCKATRDNLRLAVIARDKEVLRQRQMLDIKSKFSANNSAADSELLKAKLEVNRTNKEIDEIVGNFEKRKLTDIKTILTDFVLISMKFHTKALEALSASYYDVSNIDERSDYLEFQKLMKTKEEPHTRKLTMKKGLRSQSMDSLDQLLSPKRRGRKLSRSSKNLAGKTEPDDDDEEDDDNDDDDDEEESEDNDEDDEEDNEDEEESEESASEAKVSTVDVKKSREKPPVKHPFKAVAKTHVFKRTKAARNQGKPFAAKSGIPLTSGNGVSSSVGSGGRLVTVVESKKQSAVQHAASSEAAAAEVIDCTRGASLRK